MPVKSRIKVILVEKDIVLIDSPILYLFLNHPFPYSLTFYFYMSSVNSIISSIIFPIYSMVFNKGFSVVMSTPAFLANSTGV